MKAHAQVLHATEGTHRRPHSVPSHSYGTGEGHWFEERLRASGKNHGCTLSDETFIGVVPWAQWEPPVQGGIQILGSVPLFQEQIVVMV